MICLYGLQCPDTPVGCKRERTGPSQDQFKLGVMWLSTVQDSVHTGLFQPDLVLT